VPGAREGHCHELCPGATSRGSETHRIQTDSPCLYREPLKLRISEIEIFKVLFIFIYTNT
jgi:hypothetical protein